MMSMKKKLTLLLTAGLLVSMTAAPVMAEHTDVNGSCYFNGTKIVSDFTSQELADAVTSLQPGDDVSFTVTYTNNYNASTDWYMENEILKTLEKASATRAINGVEQTSKQVSGTGQAEHGAYTYELIHYDSGGHREVLFSNKEVGGDTVAGGMEGLEQATNALDDWFYIQTLTQGQSGRVVLNVAFDGETEVNDYMDTNGGLAVRFAVELNKTGTTVNAANAARTVSYSAVKTGDPTNFPLIIGALAAGVVLLIVALRLRKKANDGEEEETGGDDE